MILQFGDDAFRLAGEADVLAAKDVFEPLVGKSRSVFKGPLLVRSWLRFSFDLGDTHAVTLSRFDDERNNRGEIA